MSIEKSKNENNVET